MSASEQPRTWTTTARSAGAAAVSVGQGDTLAGGFASALRGANAAAARFAARVRGGLFDSAPPQDIARYRLERVLGRGGMGEVWVARDEQLGREVAVKLVHPSRSDDEQHLTQLAREARALARLAHPNVVAVFDLGHYPAPHGRRGLFIVMELVDGVPLSAWLARPREIAEIVRVFAQAGRGLAAAHGAGLVHRDVKPANIFVGHDGRVRVGDFGLARRASGAAELGATTLGDAVAHDATHGEPTGSGVVMGTPVYMAPEQHLGAAVDASADQYALCVALFEALWGARPFSGNLHALLEAKLQGPPQRVPARGRASPSPALEAVVRRGLSPSPSDRWPSMDAFVEALLASQRRGVRPLWWIAGVAIAALGLGASARERCGAALSGSVREASEALPQALATVRDAVPGPSQAQWVERLQAWPQQFERALGSVCERDPQAHSSRWDCLSRARHGYAAIVHGLADEPTLASGAVTTMTNELQDPSACVELARPSSVPPQLRPQLDDALARMQHAVARRAFRPDEALSELREVAATLERIGPSEALAWTQHELGMTYDAVSAWADAGQLYEACYLTAVQVDDDDQALRCALMSASKAAEQGDDEGMRRWLAHTDALLERGPSDPERRALRASAIATAAFVRGAYGEAAAGMREAVALCREAGCDQLAVSTAIGLASAESLRGDADAALAAWQQAQAIVEAHTGPQSRDARTVRFRLIQARVGLGQVEAALAEFDAMIAALEGEPAPDAVLLARVWAAQGDALQRLGRAGAATSSMRALAWARLAYADAPQLLVPYLLEAGQLLALQDAPAAAEALYAEAAPLVEE
ncbi:MAG: serine/threonine protein kinase, partial [Nannocystaceae bacterium]|nr:serine/threonine protein kinase [Nannocystaceae bacterium]